MYCTPETLYNVAFYGHFYVDTGRQKSLGESQNFNLVLW